MLKEAAEGLLQALQGVLQDVNEAAGVLGRCVAMVDDIAALTSRREETAELLARSQGARERVAASVSPVGGSGSNIAAHVEQFLLNHNGSAKVAEIAAVVTAEVGCKADSVRRVLGAHEGQRWTKVSHGRYRAQSVAKVA